MSKRNSVKSSNIKSSAIWLQGKKFCIKKSEPKFHLRLSFSCLRIKTRLKTWWIWSCSLERSVITLICLRGSWPELHWFFTLIFFIRSIFTTVRSISVLLFRAARIRTLLTILYRDWFWKIIRKNLLVKSL